MEPVLLSLAGYDLATSATYELVDATTSKLVDNQEVTEKVEGITINGNSLVVNAASLPWYILATVKVTPYMEETPLQSFMATIALVQDTDNEEFTKLLGNGFYLHGRAGKFDEIDYNDASYNNQILPCRWYDKQEPFEFEFIVNGKKGLHKIFNNLVIISNNVQPDELEFEVEGDVFGINKAGIFRGVTFNEDEWKFVPEQRSKSGRYKKSQVLDNARVKWDTVTDKYSIVMTQKTKDIKTLGRLLGNIEYKEDS